MSKASSTREVSVAEIKPKVVVALANIKLAREEEWADKKAEWLADYAKKQAKSWRVRFFGGEIRVKNDADADYELRHDDGAAFEPSTRWWVERKWELGEEMMERLYDLCTVAKETDTMHITAEDAQVLRGWANWTPKK